MARVARGSCFCRNQRKKHALAETKSQYNQVVTENKKLLQQWDDTQRDTYQVTEHLRSELLIKAHRVAELEAGLLKLRSEHEVELQQLRSDLETQHAESRSEAAAEIESLTSTVEELQSELDSLSSFRHHQREVEGEVLRLKEEKQELKEMMENQPRSWTLNVIIWN